MVSLQINATDNLSGVDMLSFSTDGNDWGLWEDYIETKSYELSSGNGEKIIYFRVKDRVGNIASPVSATIVLNIESPPDREKESLSKSSYGINVWLIIIIIIIIVIVLISMGLVWVNKRKKRAGQELLSPGVLTIKPGGLSGPIISVGKVSTTATAPQLASPTAVSSAKGSHMNTIAAQIPMLARSASTQAIHPQSSLAQAPQQQVVPRQRHQEV